MEKLIRFINEYGHTSNCWPFETCRIKPATEWNSSYLLLSRDDNWEWDWKDWAVSIPRLISKEYGFIWWLVENNKIKPLRKFIGWETDEDEPYIQFDLVDQYIAYLSIQDEPIRFLCEILK